MAIITNANERKKFFKPKFFLATINLQISKILTFSYVIITKAKAFASMIAFIISSVQAANRLASHRYNGCIGAKAKAFASMIASIIT